MPDFPDQSESLENVSVINSFGRDQLGAALKNTSANISLSVGWPVIKKVIYVPFYTNKHITVYGMSIINGTAVSGNLDIGIYDLWSKSKIVSSGSTAQTGTSTIQTFTLSTTVLRPGNYYMALVLDNTSGQVGEFAITNPLAEACGVKQETIANLPLPATATPIAPTSDYVPVISVHLTSVF